MEQEQALQPLIVPHNIDDLIAQHMLNLFNRFRDTAIPGQIEMTIRAHASSGAREIAVEHKCTVGPWDQQATFKSASLNLSFERSVDRYRDQTANDVKMLSAS